MFGQAWGVGDGGNRKLRSVCLQYPGRSCLWLPAHFIRCHSASSLTSALDSYPDIHMWLLCSHVGQSGLAWSQRHLCVLCVCCVCVIGIGDWQYCILSLHLSLRNENSKVFEADIWDKIWEDQSKINKAHGKWPTRSLSLISVNRRTTIHAYFPAESPCAGRVMGKSWT